MELATKVVNLGSPM